MSLNTLPSRQTMEKLLQCLFGDKVEVRSSAPAPDLSKPYVVASYVDDAGIVRRILVCELALANSMGAAMSMIPACVASEATKEGIIADNIHGNLSEVLNICVNLFTDGQVCRLAFSKLRVCSPNDPMPAITASLKYALNIPRYAGGSLLAGSV